MSTTHLTDNEYRMIKENLMDLILTAARSLNDNNLDDAKESLESANTGMSEFVDLTSYRTIKVD